MEVLRIVVQVVTVGLVCFYSGWIAAEVVKYRRSKNE